MHKSIFIGLFALSPFLFSFGPCQSMAQEQEEPQHMSYSCITVPKSVEFCGIPIDLTRFDRHERMDRELMAFTYMHSTSLQIIKRANRYFPVVEPILKENGIPDDFKYLMAIESNVNPLARSGAGAAGLWQFMQGTAREFGLEVNHHVDERYHVEKSTQAACRYLKQAYARFGNWETVAASYNAGQGRITREQDKQFTENALDLHLVEETARYVYRILAVKSCLPIPHSSASISGQATCIRPFLTGTLRLHRPSTTSHALPKATALLMPCCGT